MEKAKYHPEEVDRMIDQEIARIDEANALAEAEAAAAREPKKRGLFSKWLGRRGNGSRPSKR